METRNLFGGIDTDSSPRLIDPSALLNAVNVRTFVSNSQNTTDAQFILGNTALTSVSDILPTGNQTLIGKVSDSRYIFLFFYNDQDNHSIIRYDTEADLAQIYLLDSYVIQGLGWNPTTIIDARLTPDFLLWAAAGFDPMYINTNYNYASIAPFDIDVLTVISSPPVVPLQCSRVTNTPAYGDIQFIPLQFTYRITNLDNSVSVLAPYSLTMLPVRQSQVNSNPNTGNSIDITVNLAQKFPPNWKTIELVVRYVTGNTFNVIKQYNSDVIADRIIIDYHNSGIAAVNYVWLGRNLYQLDQNYISKLFDNVPVQSAHLEVADNRLFLANNIEGYDTPSLLPGYSTTKTNYTVAAPSTTTIQTFILSAQKQTTAELYFAVIFRQGGKNYLLPKDCSIGHVSELHTWSNGGVMDSPGYLTTDVDLWTVPQTIAREAVIELKESQDPSLTTLGQASGGGIEEVRYSIVAEANEVNFLDILDFSQLGCFTYKQFTLVDTPSEFGPASQSRAFLPNGTYNLGIDYYDSALRKCGVLPLTTFNIDPYGPFSRQLTERLNFTINNTVASVPSFAHHYAITMSKQQESTRIIQFVANIIKVALQDNDGLITLSGYQSLVSTPAGNVIYGLAIPIINLVKYGYGYAYNSGDYIELVGYNSAGSADTSVIKGFVKAVQNGYVIINYDSSKLSELSKIVPESTKYIFQSGLTALTSPPYDVAWNAWQAELISIPAIYDPPVPNPQPPLSTSILTKRQWTTVVTLYNSIPGDSELYEVAKFGQILNPGAGATYGNFYDSASLTTALYGDHYTQIRTGAAGALTCVSITTYDLINQFAINDTGRVTEIDRIGQSSLPTIIRFSNTKIPGTNTNGYFSFDGLDYKIIEETAGSITYLTLTTKAIQEGGQMVILCSNNSFVTLVGKQQVYGADQDGAFVINAATQVLGDINPLKGNWACSSPKSVITYQGKVWWVDIKNREIVEFGEGGANPVSQFKANRLWTTILKQISDPTLITAGVNPYSSEYLISVPELAQTKNLLTTTALEDPFNAYYSDNRTYIYNWEVNKWVGSWQCGSEFVNVGDRVFGWKGQILYEEFTGDPGVYCGETFNAIISIPFNEKYPLVKSPEAIRADCNMIPIQCFVYAFAEQFGEQVAQCADFSYREGDMMAQVLRNRLSENANTSQDWDNSGINGDTLKGKVIQAAFIFAPSDFYMSSASLVYRASSGH